MSEESNLLKLVAEVGAKIEAVKSKISAGGIENEKWKTNLLETQKSLSERKQRLLKLRVRMSSEKEQLAEKEENFNARLTDVQSGLSALTEMRCGLAQAQLELEQVRLQRQRLQEQQHQHAADTQWAASSTESAGQLTDEHLRLDNLRQERCALEGRLRQGAALRGVQQEVAAAAARRHTLQQRLGERCAAEEADAAAADRLQRQLQLKQEEMSGEQQALSDQLSSARDQQRQENERLRSLELRTAELRAQLDGAGGEPSR